MAGWLLAQPGLGTSLISYLDRRDFPVVFGIVWVLVIIVVSAKLAAELIEIAYNHFAGRTAAIEPDAAKTGNKKRHPKRLADILVGALCFCHPRRDNRSVIRA